MKKTIIFTGLLFAFFTTIAQVGIGTVTPEASSQLDITATDKGILIPRMTEVQRDAISLPATSLLIYQTDNTSGYYYYNGSAWISFKGVEKIDDLIDGKSDSDGSQDGSSVFLGIDAGLNDDSTNNMNVGVGFNSLKSNTTGYYNTANGYASLYTNVGGSNNTANGTFSLSFNTGGSGNTAIGMNALYNNTLGDGNTANGGGSLYTNTEGINNTANGVNSLHFNALGDYNTALGYQAGLLSVGDSNVFLGHQAGYNETGSNKLYIENIATTADNALIYGEFGVDNTTTGNILRTNSQFQIGNPTVSGYAFPTIDGTSNQVLSTDGSGTMSWVTPTDADVTEVLAGDGLINGGASGAITLDVVATNGLTDTADDIRLGGTLTENTTFSQGAYGMTFNLNSTGDFKIQDVGVTQFEIADTGISYFGNDTYWKDANTSGTVLARIYDNVDDGQFDLYSNGLVQHKLNTVGTTVFNEQGFAVDFRVESNGNANMFFVDASTNRVGIGTLVPVSRFHVSGGRVEFTNTTDATGTAGSGVLEIGNSLRLDGNEIITNTNSILSIQADNNGDLRVDTNTLVVDASANRVGIGTTFPAYQLTLTTNSAAKPTSSAWTIASDERLKTNVKPFTEGLSLINKINPVWFTYNGKAGMPNETGVGTLAQEFQKIAPYMVKPWEYNNEKGVSETYLGIDYGPLTFVIVNAIQEQQQEIEELKEQLESQQKEIDAIKAMLSKQ